jgi:hypothetical protein
MPAIDREYVRRLEDFSTALEGIVELLKQDTKRENVDNVTRLLSNMDGSIGEIVKNIEIIKESVDKIGEQNDKIIREIQELKKQKEGGGLGNISEVDNKKKILDAVQVIILIAGGILAIGLAFKLIAPVDFMSVLAIGLALVFITGAFVAVSNITKEMDSKKVKQTMGLMIMMAGAISVSSWLLAISASITLVKSLSIIMITATLGVSLYLMAKAINDSKLEAKDYSKMLLLPLVLPLIAAGIALSSFFLSMISPMSIAQVLTTVFVAGAMGMSLLLISNSLKETEIKSDTVGKFLLLPIVLPAVAAGLVASSLVLQFIKPLSFAQMLSTIFIAATIGIVIFLMKPLIENLGDLDLKSVVNTGLMMAAISVGIVAASWILTKISYFSFKEALGLVITSIAIGISVLALTPAILLLKKINDKEIWQGTKNIVLISGAIAISSLLLAVGNYSNYPDWKWSIGVGLSMIAFSGAMLMIDKMGKIDAKKMLSLGAIMIGISGTIVLTSLILSIGNYDKYPTLGWTIGVGLSMIAFGGAMYLLGKNKNVNDFIKGGLIAFTVAGTITIISFILGIGNYKQYPTLEWGLGAGMSLLAFGRAMMLMGKMDPVSILLGSAAVMLVAGVIALSSHILAMGLYKNYPTLDWAAGTGLSMITFGGSMALLGILTIATGGLGLAGMAVGALAMLIIATTVVGVSKILSGGVYTGGPSIEWALGTGALLLAVGLTSGTFALLYPLIKLGSISMRSIAKTIADVSIILQKGNYKGGPTLEWAKGVSMSIRAFAEGSMMLSGGIIGSLISKLFGIDQTSIIKKIAQSMVDASYILQKGVWSAYPSEEWSKGVGDSIMAFATAIQALDDADIDTGREFSTTIGYIVKGIIQAAEDFNKFDWSSIKNYPSEDWSTAVGAAINAFAKPLAELAENDITGREIKTGIKKLAQGMVEAARIFAQIDWNKYNSNYPRQEWVNGVGKALEVFVNYLVEIEKNDIGRGDITVLKKTIDAMIYSAIKFRLAETIVNGLWESGPTSEWSSRVGKSIGVFVKYLSDIEKNGIGTGDLKILNKTIDTMLSVARRFKLAELIFKDIWKAGPTDDWSRNTGKVIETFVEFLERINNSKLDKSDLKILNSTIDSMIHTAHRFMISEFLYKDLWKAGPTNSWVKRTGEAISLFVNYLQQIVSSGADFKDLKILNGTIDTMISTALSFKTAQMLHKNLWSAGPSMEWVLSTGLAINTFVNNLKEIEESGVSLRGLILLENTINRIITTAKSFQKAQKDAPGLWTSGPSEYWVNSIGKALSIFVKYLVDIENSNIGFGDMRILNRTINAIIKISNKFKGGQVTGGPTVEWSESIGKALGVFVKYLSIIESQNIGKGDTTNILNKTVDGIIRTALRFSFAEKKSPTLWQSGPSEYWTDNIGKALSVFFKHLAMIDGMNIRNFELRVLNRTVDSIIDTALQFYIAEKTHGKGIWQAGPSLEWASSVGVVVSKFASYIATMDKSDFSSRDVRKLNKIVGSIINTAERYYELESSKPGVWKAGPSLDWALGVSKTIMAFAQASIIVGNSKNLAGIDGLGDKMMSFTLKLEKAISGKKVFGKGGLFETFTQSIKNLSSSFNETDQMAKGINQFANVLVKISSMGTSSTDSIKMLTKSITQLSDALEDVDMESIDKLSKFSNGILVLSLIDEEKFEKSLDVLQSKKNDIISILSNNSTIKTPRQDYGMSRVQMTSVESKESKDFYVKALGHMSKLDTNVGKMLEKIGTPAPLASNNNDDMLIPTNEPSKFNSKK